MEIIKRGTPPDEIEYEAKCNNCKTEIKFKRSEAVVTFDQREGDYMSISCPVCFSQIHRSLK